MHWVKGNGNVQNCKGLPEKTAILSSNITLSWAIKPGMLFSMMGGNPGIPVLALIVNPPPCSQASSQFMGVR